MSKKLILIDGNSIINRAFYGIPDLTSADGLHTNAIYGFLNIIFSILSEENGDYLCVAFDLKAPTFRHKMYPEYKGTRKGMPDELREQVPVLKELLRAMNITIVEKEGYEADDILGTLARRGEREGLDVTLVSGDRDLLQIATDKILVRIPKTKGGRTEIENYHTADVIAKYSLEPLQIIELKALMGDSSDNIPGVPKIGEKTATELLKQYHDIETLKEHIGEITKKSIRESLEQNFELAELSKVLATIEVNAPVEETFDEMTFNDMYTQEAYAIIKKLGFKNMLSKFENSNTQDSNLSISENFKCISDFSMASQIIDSIKEKDKVAFYICGETIGTGADKTSEMTGISLCFSEEDIYYIPAEGMMTDRYLLSAFMDSVKDSEETEFITFGLKEQLIFISDICDYDFFRKRVNDLLIAAYLNNPLKNDYAIEDIATEYAGLLMKGRKEAFPKMTMLKASAQKSDEYIEYVCFYSYVCFKTRDVILKRLESNGMDTLYRNIEMPLIISLFSMEREGVEVRREDLTELSAKLSDDLSILEKSIHEAAGEDFNINSPAQLGVILFEKMGIPGGKKTKTGYSTAADVLEKLAPDYPFVSDILQYRAIAKLKSTYAEGLLQFVENDNRIRSTFNQTITATGRISSTDPNLQNIPVRMEQGRLIRKAFVPKEGCEFIDADYSQIELRIMAHMSEDERLIEAFNNGRDIHAITASEVFGIPIDEVTPLQRRNAKAVNFGIIYGISSFGLGQDLNISRKEAKEYIDNYFEKFPKVKRFLDKQVSDAKENGYVTTLYGRRRPLPEIKSSNFIQRGFGERVAMNAPIQGTAADIMKIAMISVDERLKRENLKSKVILQVHDELLIEAYKDEKDVVTEILVSEMENAAALSVKLLAEAQSGATWYEAK